jgi:hypothetical protein
MRSRRRPPAGLRQAPEGRRPAMAGTPARGVRRGPPHRARAQPARPGPDGRPLACQARRGLGRGPGTTRSARRRPGWGPPPEVPGPGSPARRVVRARLHPRPSLARQGLAREPGPALQAGPGQAGRATRVARAPVLQGSHRGRAGRAQAAPVPVPAACRRGRAPAGDPAASPGRAARAGQVGQAGRAAGAPAPGPQAVAARAQAPAGGRAVAPPPGPG